MKEKIDETGAEVEFEGLEMVDLGDAAVETKQPHVIQQIADSCCTFTWFGAEAE